MGRIYRRSHALAAVGVVGLAMAITGVLQAHAATPGNVFVSPSGDDSNPGSQAAPVRTLQRAQQLVRGLNQNMTADVTVVLEDGFYRLASPLSLSSADSGTGGHNVVWAAGTRAPPGVARSVQLPRLDPELAGSPLLRAPAPAP